jgi:putative SOS response-associated peptidase YedK
MCGRFTLTLPLEEVSGRFGVRPERRLPPRFNIAPGQTVPVISDDRPDRFSFLRWGFVPSWAADPGIGYRMINARAESLSEKPAFRTAFRSRRCLVPADGFYEWRKTERGSIPYYVRLKTREPFAFAGVWSVWKKGPSGGEARTFAIVTVEADEKVRRVHGRMPAILDRKDGEEWLRKEVPPERLVGILKPYPSEALEIYRVSSEVNRSRSDHPGLVRRIGRGL